MAICGATRSCWLRDSPKNEKKAEPGATANACAFHASYWRTSRVKHTPGSSLMFGEIMNIALKALITGTLQLAAGAVAGAIIYRVIAPRHDSYGALATGRRFAAWVQLVSCVALFGKFVFAPSVDSFAAWVVLTLFSGAAGFIVGLGWGALWPSKPPIVPGSHGMSRVRETPHVTPPGVSSISSGDEVGIRALEVKSRLAVLEKLLVEDAITADEYRTRRSEILSGL